MSTMKHVGWTLVPLALAGCGDLVGGGGGDGGAPVEAKFSSLYQSYLVDCKTCHAPPEVAPGYTVGTEQTADFSTLATAYTTLTTGTASGLVGNFEACNGVPLVTAGQPTASLLVASLDAATRTTFDYPAVASCDASAMGDMVLKMGAQPPEGFIDALKQWVTNGAPND